LDKQELIQLLISSNVQSSENNKSKPNKQTVNRLSQSGNSSSRRASNKNIRVTDSVQQRNKKLQIQYQNIQLDNLIKLENEIGKINLNQ